MQIKKYKNVNRIEEEIMQFHYDICGHAQAQGPLPQVSWNLQFL